MKVKTKEVKKFNFWPYFAKHKVGIIFWLILMVFDIAIQTFFGIYGAYILANISKGLSLSYNQVSRRSRPYISPFGYAP